MSVSDYEAGVLAGERAVLARAITLVESRRADDQELACALIERLLPRTGASHRIGVTGVPGVGKSTFIEALGTRLTSEGRRVAVLAVDPSSARSGGSILGDKTRMQELARDSAAFVRPSPTYGQLGGVARHTRETMLLCEAAGYDVVLVETVGVGQSEVVVAQLVDSFLVLMLAGAGDELQGIKRGILELADVLTVNKADGDNLEAARRARAEYEGALHFMTPKTPGWRVPVTICSSITRDGLDEVWSALQRHRAALQETGAWSRQRREQRLRWMWRAVEDSVLRRFRDDPRVARAAPGLEDAVARGEMIPERAAAALLAAFQREPAGE